MCAIHKERNGLLCLRTPVPINVLRTTAVGVLALSALGHHAHGLRSPLPRGEAGGWRRGRATWIGGVTSGPAPLSVSLSLLRPPPPHSPPSAIPLPLPRPTPPPARATDPSCSSPCRGPRLRARHCRCFLPVRHCRCFPLPFPLSRPSPPPSCRTAMATAAPISLTGGTLSAVLFDMDGTLVDVDSFHVRLARRPWTALGRGWG